MSEETSVPSLAAPRLSMFDTTFWEVLPSHYTAISTRFIKIANLHSRTHSDILATDRAAALNSLKAELDMFKHDLAAYHDIVKGINITDIAGIYTVAGRDPHRALQIAKQDIEYLENSVTVMQERIKECWTVATHGAGEER